jgi:hypothetical protein
MLYWGREVVPRVARADAEKSASGTARKEKRFSNGDKRSRAPQRAAGADEDLGRGPESAVSSKSGGAVATAEE